MAQENTLVLRISLDEGKTQEQLQKLVLDLEATRKAQQALRDERKAGSVTDEQFGQRSVQLQQQLRQQQQEYGSLNKSLELYRKSTSDTYEGVQSQLSLAQIQFQKTAGSQDLSTESAKALSGVIGDLRGQLLKTDEANLLFVRNVGNYPKGEALEPLLQKLVLLQEVQKQLPAGSAQAIEAQKQIGFQFGKVNEAAAAAGLSQQAVTNQLADYGERLRPATAELAKLTIAQDEAAKSAGKDSAEFAKIGFQIGAARKEIEKVPPVIKEVSPAADAATKALGDTANKGFKLLGEQGERAQALLGKFKQGNDLLSKGLTTLKGAGETGSLGFKALATGIALTGIGLFVIAISAVVTYFTQTAAGGKLLAQVMGGLGAVVNLLTSVVGKLGEGLVNAVKNPKQAFSDLVDFLEAQVINRIKAFGVILEAIQKGDFKQLANGVIQLNTGVTDGIDKMQAFGKKVNDAALAGAALVAEQKALVKARRELEVEDIREQSRVAVLLRLSKERGKTSAEQLAALKEAGRLEAELSEKNIDLQKRELAAIEEEIRLKGALKAADLLADKAAKQKEIEQSIASQNEVNAKIRVRESVFLQEQRQRALDSNKAYYEAAAAQAVEGTQAELTARVRVLEADRVKQLGALGLTENQRQAIIANSERAIRDLRRSFAYTTLQQVAALEQLDLDRRIKDTQAGSEEELALMQRKLTVQRNLELSAVNLTVRQAQAIREKYLAEGEKLEDEFRKKQILAAYDAELAKVNRQVTLAQRGSQQETELKVAALEKALERELALLDKRQDNTERAALLRSNTERQIQDVRYAQAAKATEQYIQGEKNALDEQLASGKITQAAYDKTTLDADVQNAQMRLNVAKAFGQQTDALEQQFTDAKIKKIKSVTAADRAEQEKRIEYARTLTSGLVDLFAETIATTGAGLEDFSRKALILLIDGVEKAVLGAEIEIVAKSFASWDSIASYGVAGYAKSAAIIAATVGAAEILKSQLTPPPRQFAGGTVLGGNSHAQGGVQLYSRAGHHWGEAEADEVVLTAGVWRSPLLRPLASQLNVLGGGQPLMPSAHMALGGVIQPMAQAQLRGMGSGADAVAIGAAVAEALRLNPAYVRWVDFESAQARNQFTQGIASR